LCARSNVEASLRAYVLQCRALQRHKRELPIGWAEKLLELMGVSDAAQESRQKASLSLEAASLDVSATKLNETFNGTITMRGQGAGEGGGMLPSSAIGKGGKASRESTVTQGGGELSKEELTMVRVALDNANPATPQEVNEILVLLRRVELLPVTLALLEVTGIGKSLNSMKKRVKHPGIKRESTALLAHWKALVAAGPQGTAGITSRAQNLLASALKPEHKGPESSLKALAGTIDAALWRRLGASSETEDERTRGLYKGAMMKLVSNLKHPENTELRGRVLRGEVSPDQLAGFDAYELAAPKARAVMDAKRASDDAVMAQMEQRISESYDKSKACNQCGEYTLIVTETQSRPIVGTDAVSQCTSCGNSWTTEGG
jgi:transcription elongation factor S-II